MPEDVRAICSRLRTAGGHSWLVGGAVRDLLLHHAVRDWDLATDLLPDRLLALFPEAEQRDLRLGALRIEVASGSAVLTSLRAEADYRDHRHPATVTFGVSLELDAARRDFTVNALYLDIDSGRLHDPTGGRADLERGLLRCIGEPARRFTEDALRLLRAVRFAGTLGLRIERATAAAAAAHGNLLTHLSPERAFAELTAMFTGRGRGRALRLLFALGMCRVLLPEVAAMDGVTQPPEYHPEGDVLIHTCLVLDQVAAGDPVQAWAAVLHDVGKPPCWRQAADRIRFDGHDVVSAEMAAEVLLRLRAPGSLREAVVDIVREHIRFAVLPEMRPARRAKWMRQESFPRHLAFHRADCLASHGDLSRYRMALELYRVLPPEAPPPLCRGADLLALGVPPGPLVGTLLRELHERAEALGIDDREQALAMLRELAGPHVKPALPPGR